jgi:phospholipid transport system substrate-binding protein
MRLVSRRTVLGLALAGLAVAPRRVFAANVGNTADAADVTAPIDALNEALAQVMKAGGRTPFRERFQMLAPAIDRAFDLPGILRVSIGPSWSSIDPSLQVALTTAFRRFTVASYVANFNSYDGERFKVGSILRRSGADQVVDTTIVPEKGEAIRVDYVMRQEGAAWKAVDVLLDGTISRVAVQRSDFRSLLAQGGATALIVSLQSKVADLAGGSLES